MLTERKISMENIIILLVVGMIVGAAAGYIWKEKRKGVKCVGCPYASGCGGNCSGCKSQEP